MIQKIFGACLIVLSTLVLSCTSSTKITASWVDPSLNNGNRQGGYNATSGETSPKSVLVASLSRNMEVRTKLEDALANEAAKRNIKVIKSTTQFSPDFYQNTPSREDLLASINKTGVDAILTVSLINKESETRYVRGSTPYSPFTAYRWYGGFYNYYNYWRPYFYDPGYYVTDKTYFLETNVYDAKTEKLLWSAQSETVNPASIDKFVKEYPKVLVRQMVKDGLLKK
jgi:hypothetical protein